MNRRGFTKAALSSLFVLPAVARSRTGIGARRPEPPKQVFYDDRFPAARQLAAALSTEVELTPVRGDMTELWNTGLRRACLRSPLTLQGVTTQSFFFCLKGMLESHARVRAQVSRVDRDLLLWKLQSMNRTA